MHFIALWQLFNQHLSHKYYTADYLCNPNIKNKKGWLRLANTSGPYIFSRPDAGMQRSKQQFQNVMLIPKIKYIYLINIYLSYIYISLRNLFVDSPWYHKQPEQHKNAFILDYYETIKYYKIVVEK